MNKLILINNRLCKLMGALIKGGSYTFHWAFTKLSFTIPAYSHAKIKPKASSVIPKHIWQTNFTNKVTLPVYINYLYNRLMSLDWDYHYVSTEDRLTFIENNATPEQIAAFKRLAVGAAQVDIWRILVLNKLGGVYMDIDAHAVWPLSKIIKPKEQQIILSRQHDYTNYFIASAPNNQLLTDILDKAINNIINNNEQQASVYGLTGPGVMNEVIGNKEINHRSYKITCIQGSFTNEYFQYMDKPKGKWTHVDNKDLLK